MTYVNTVTSASSGSSTLQINILSVEPTMIAFPAPRKHMRLGVMAVRIRNPITEETKSIYAFHDIGSQMTLLRKWMADEIALTCKVHLQPCCGMHVDTDVLMEDASL